MTDLSSQVPPNSQAPGPGTKGDSSEVMAALTLWAWWGLSGSSSAPEGSAPT